MVKVKQTTNEYLLWIVYQQKHRAKSIEGYRWDGTRKCWVYPRTRRVYDALIAEFGDDLGIDTLSPPDGQPDGARPAPATAPGPAKKPVRQAPVTKLSPAPPPESPPPGANDQLLAAIQSENNDLRSEMAKIQEALKSIHRVSPAGQDGRVADLLKTVAEREQEIAKLKRELREAQHHYVATRAELAAKETELKQLRNAPKAVTDAEFENMLKNLALSVTRGDREFRHIISTSSVGLDLPITMARYLEIRLRRLLGVLGKYNESMTLYDLISMAKDTDTLAPDAVDLAHLIRKQRNIVAHGPADSSSLQLRALLCLFAAALLWPEFPDD